jgi:hypothetical protein
MRIGNTGSPPVLGYKFVGPTFLSRPRDLVVARKVGCPSGVLGQIYTRSSPRRQVQINRGARVVHKPLIPLVALPNA